MPCLCAYQASTSENNSSAKTTKLNERLDSTWTSSMLLVTDKPTSDQHAEEGPVAKLFAPSQCFKLGTCVCGNWSATLGPCVALFNTRLIAYLKDRCWSKKKQKSEPRKLLERAFVVLGLEAKAPANENVGKCIRTRIYLHIGFVNFLTWQFTVLPLYEGDLYGSEAVEDRLLRTWGLAQKPSSDDLDVCTDEFQTCIDFIKDNIDVRLPYSAHLYEIESSCHEPLHPVDFKSGYVTITKIRDLDHDGEDGVVFWKGSSVELRSNKKRKTTTRDGRTSRKTQKADADTTRKSRKDDADTMLALEDGVDSDNDTDDDGDNVNLEDHFADMDMQDGNGSASDSNGDSNPADGDDHEGGTVSDDSDDLWNGVLDEMEQLRTAKPDNGNDSNAGSMDDDSSSSSSDSSSSRSSESSHRGGQQQREGHHGPRAPPATSLPQQLRSLLPQAGVSGEMSISRDPNSYGYRVLYPHGISA